MPNSGRPHRIFNGLALIVAIIREADPIFRKDLIKKIQNASPLIAKLVDHCEFIYTDIARLDKRSLEFILAKIPEDDWLLAWKLTPENLQRVLLTHMTERRQLEFVRLAKDMPKVHKKKVYLAQMRIAQKTHQWLREGKLGLTSRRLNRPF